MKVIVDIPEDVIEATKNGSANIYNLCGYLMNGKIIEPCENAISRQAVMDALCNDCELFRNREQTCFTKCEEYHFLATLPSVTPQPKTEHGKWISEMVDGEDWKGCKRQYYQPISCSKCHSPNLYKSTYCPNCGAKMQESEG